jgi:phage shock protein B
MTAVAIVGIMFAGLVLSLAIVGGTILLGIKLKHGSISRPQRERMAEETRMIQEIYSGLSEMEARIEALETILMDGQEKEGQGHG